MKKLLLYSTCIIALTACHTKNTQPVTDSAAVYTVPDDEAITQAVHDAYASVTFKKGDTPNYEAIKTHFIPQAQLINYGSDTTQVFTINQFVYLYRSFVEADTVYAYSEKEIFGKNEQFGKIAQRISSYTSATNSKKKDSTETGVNSFQLIKTPTGWKVSSIIWDVEKKGLKVPGYYLGK
ncbi:hypothetical protein [Mucilaginibacter sp. L196]|uniref:hypothetical protein n=1 Tax=Mucilaginibacter sp. L196 TaxID=1641870 RepID=UPI00131ACB39|nr:hypothetical protein [Mucilaginibacter sp. L196]